MKLCTLFVLFVFLACATATHFRYGTIRWFATDPANQRAQRFEVSTAFRRSFFGAPNVGSTIVPGSFCFGDGSCVNLNVLISAINTADDWVIGSTVLTHTYSSTGTFIAYHDNCCRISTLQNNHDTEWRIESRVVVNTASPDTSPICAGLPIVPVAQQTAAVAYTIPANDNDVGDSIVFTLATPAQLGASNEVHPPTLSVTSGGVVSLSTTNFVIGGLYTTQQIITDTHLGYIPIDYIISVSNVKKQCDPACGLQPQQCFTPSDCGFCPDPDNTCVQGKPEVITRSNTPPPYSNPRTEANGFSTVIAPNVQYFLAFVAHDAQFTQPTKIVTIYNANIPSAASVTVQAPCDSASSCTCVGCNNPQIRRMTWTPTNADIGSNFPICIGVRSSDGTELPYSQHCITVRVTGDPTTGTTGTTGTTDVSTGTTKNPTTGTTGTTATTQNPTTATTGSTGSTGSTGTTGDPAVRNCNKLDFRSADLHMICDSTNVAPPTVSIVPSSGGVRNTNAPPTDPTKKLVYYIHGLFSTYIGGGTSLNLWVNSVVNSQAFAIEVAYDWTGDGVYDRKEIFAVAPNNNPTDYQNFVKTGTTTNYQDLVKGSIRVTLWSAYATTGELYIKTDTALQGQLSFINIPYSPSNWFVSLATTGDPTTGTTGTTGAPLCPYQGKNTITASLNGPDAFKTDNKIGAPFVNIEYITGQFSLKSSQFYEAFITRYHLLSNGLQSSAKFKARLDAIVEFWDYGAVGYDESVDPVLQSWDLTVTEIFWALPIVGLDANNQWTVYLPDNVNPLMILQGTVDKQQHPCINYPFVPSPTSLSVTVDFSPYYVDTASKIALQFQYTYYEDQGPNDNIVIAGGAVEGTLFEEFNPDGFPTTATTVPGGSSVNVYSSFIDEREGQNSTKPEYTVYFAFDSTAHTGFNVQVIKSRHF